MPDYIVINGTEAQLSNVNAAGHDVPKNSARTVTLTAVELDALLNANAGVAAIKSTSTLEQRRKAARVLKYRKTQAGAAL